MEYDPENPRDSSYSLHKKYQFLRNRSFYLQDNVAYRSLLKRRQPLDGTKNEKITFYELVDTLFWRHSALKKNPSLRKFAHNSYFNSGHYQLAWFHNDMSATEALRISPFEWRPKAKREVFGWPIGLRKKQFIFHTPLLNPQMFSAYDNDPLNRHWLGFNVKDDDALRFKAVTSVDTSHPLQPKKYVILKSTLLSAHYDFNTDISYRLLSDDLIKPYFSVLKFYEDKDLLHTFSKGGYFDGPYAWRLRYRGIRWRRHYFPKKLGQDYFKYNHERGFLAQGQNIYDPNLLWDGLLNDTITNSSDKIFKQSPNVFDSRIDNVTYLFLNNFYDTEQYHKHVIKDQHLLRNTLPNYSLEFKLDKAWSLFSSSGDTISLSDSFLTEGTQLFPQRPKHTLLEQAQNIYPGLQHIDRSLLSDTPVSLNLPWAGFWFPGNIYSPFHDYDSTSVALEARKMRKSLTYSPLNHITNSLIFLDPHFRDQPGVVLGNFSFNMLQLVFCVSLFVSAITYLFLLFRFQILLVWLLNYLHESDFWHLRVLLNINFYPIIQFILRKMLAITYWTLIISLVFFLWKSSLFFTLRFPYKWRMFNLQTASSRFNQDAPLQSPFTMLTPLRIQRTRRAKRWWRIKTQKEEEWDAARYKTLYGRINHYRKHRRKLTKMIAFYKIPRRWSADFIDRYEPFYYWNIYQHHNNKAHKFHQGQYKQTVDRYVFSDFGFRRLRRFALRYNGYKHRNKNRLVKYNFPNVYAYKMYFFPLLHGNTMSKSFYPVNLNHIPLKSRKLSRISSELKYRGINSKLYPFARISYYQRKFASKVPYYDVYRYRWGHKWRNKHRHYKGRVFTGNQLFQGVSSVPLKSYWGSSHRMHLGVIIPAYYKIFKHKLALIKLKFKTVYYPYQTLFNPTAYVRLNTLRNRWLPGRLYYKRKHRTGFRKYYSFFDRPLVKRFDRYVPKFLHRFLYQKFDIRPLQLKSLQTPVRLIRYSRPIFFAGSSLVYYFKNSTELVFSFIKVLSDHFFHFILILFVSIFAFLKRPPLQPLPFAVNFGARHYRNWSVVNERFLRVLAKRHEPVLRPRRVKKFHYEFWTSTSSSTRRTTSRTGTKR